MNGTYENIDCMELMATLKDKEVDLAIVDPPYGIGAANKEGGIGGINKNGNAKWKSQRLNNYKASKWDSEIPNKEYFSELFRVSKNQIIFGGNYFIQNLKNTSCFIVWDKKTSGNFADCELAWTSFNSAVRKFEWLWNGFQKQEPEERFHPTQKPVKLYEWLLSNYAKPNDLILDTHCGSASSLIACENLGFKYVASELDKDYYSQSLQRLEAHLSQGKLFQRVGANEIIPEKGLFE